MFLKIFKRSFKRSTKTIVLLSCISVAISLLMGIFFAITQKYIENKYIEILSGIFLYLTTLGISGLGFCSMIIVYNNFRKAVTTDEAYLTFTLPATAGEQVGARYLSVLVWNVIISVAMVVSYVLLFITSGILEFNGIKTDSTVSIPPEVILIIFEVIVLSLVFFLSMPIHVMFAIVFNSVLANKMKSKASVIIVVLLAYAEYLIIGAIFAFMFITSLIFNQISIIHLSIWLLSIIIGGLGVLFYFLTKMFFGKKLNLA